MPTGSAPIRRRYADASDLHALLQFASRSLAERSPLGATWHPGDIAWELRGDYDSKQPIRFWESDGTVQALAWFVGPGQLWLEATPAGEALVADALGWAEESLRRHAGSGQAPALSVRAFHGDLRRVQQLERLGFVQAGPEAVQFEFDLAGEPPRPELPAGFCVQDCVDVDVEKRAASHRDAWNDLAHIGIANASSSFSAAIYESVRNSPAYRPTLDLVVAAPDGALVASCICWADERSGIGIFEPMGTHPEFRGRRLARALLAEGLRRLKASGHARARIGTAPFNTSAIAAYSSVFRLSDRSSWWSKNL